MLPCPCHRSQFIRHPAYHRDSHPAHYSSLRWLSRCCPPWCQAPGPWHQVWGRHWPGGGHWSGVQQAGPGCLGSREESSVVCRHRPSEDLTQGAPDTGWEQRDIRRRDYMRCWVVTSSKKPGPLTNIAQVPTLGSETGSLVSGAAFISSAPATWHPPPTQVSSGHQWNYLNVPRENFLSAGK